MDFQTTVSEIMSRDVITVSPDERVEDFKTLFKRRGIHHLIVEDSGQKLVGIISNEDVHRNYRSIQIVPNLCAEHIMTTCPMTIQEDGLAVDAVYLFLQNRYRALPVLNKDEELVGIVTTYDLMKELLSGHDLERELEDEEDYV